MKKLIKIIINKFIAKRNNVIIGKNTDIFRNNIFSGKSKIGSNTLLYHSSLGHSSYIGQYCKFYNLSIGKYCSIANNIKNEIAVHPTNIFVSTSPCFYSTRKQAGFTYADKDDFEEYIGNIDGENYSVIIGNDVWVGNDVIIIGNVRIGDGAIVGTGAVVTKDVPPYTIVGGVPAKSIKKRFTDEQIEFLLEFKWWDKDEEWIKKNIKFFRNIESFMEKFNQDKEEF